MTNIAHCAETSERNRGIVPLTVILMASVALNVALAHRIRGFMHAQEAQITKISDQQLKIGAVVPPFTVKRADRSDEPAVTIRYDESNRPTVLYVFTPQCGWCKKNLESLKALIAKKDREYRFIGVSLTSEGVTQYALEQKLGIPIYHGITKEAEQIYKIIGTPQTIVVSPNGIVLREWSGAYMGLQKAEVEQFFSVRLPVIQFDPTKS